MYMKSEDVPTYGTNSTASDDEVIAKALSIIKRRLTKPGEVMSSPLLIKNYLIIELAELEHEVFVAIFLDAQHRVLEYREMFRGTLTQTSVYPREVVKRALELGASAIILVHNHPSGDPSPSPEDLEVTRRLAEAGRILGVTLLDHVVWSRCGDFRSLRDESPQLFSPAP